MRRSSNRISSTPPRRPNLARRYRRRAMATSIVALVLICVSCTKGDQRVVVESAAGSPSYGIAPRALPKGFTRSGKEVELTGADPYDSISKPVDARLFRSVNGDYLRLDGDHDALEGFVPAGIESAVEFAGGRGGVHEEGGRYFLLVASDQSEVGVVSARSLIIGPPVGSGVTKSEFLAIAYQLGQSVPVETSASLESTGDLSPYVGAAPGKLVKYVNDSGTVLLVHSFTGYKLDPIIGSVDPSVERIRVGQSEAFVFGDGKKQGTTVALSGPAGDLVIVSAPEGGVDRDAVLYASQSIEEVQS